MSGQMMHGFFHRVPLGKKDPILSLTTAFNGDIRSDRINLGVGAYRSDNLHPYVLDCVQEAEKLLAQESLNKEYLPIDGDPEYCALSRRLLFGEALDKEIGEFICTAQTLAGSGALRIGGTLVEKEIGPTIYVSDPTWSPHISIFNAAGLNVEYYPYYDPETKKVDFEKMKGALSDLPQGSVVLLQACCHNPTGVDLTQDQWKELAEIFKSYSLLPFFDIAYQGFAESLEQDAFAVRHFAQEGLELLVAQSYSKNMGLYGERAGALHVVTRDAETAAKVQSQIKIHIRGNYSSPPLNTARIVKTVLGNPVLCRQWESEVKVMRDRIKSMRSLLFNLLSEQIDEVDFSFLLQQNGMFSLLGASKEQVERLVNEFSLYMPANGRINIAGLTTGNTEYVVKAIATIFANET